ncbi:hypothetical protein FFLO_05334 [Filobasidium floriforme]|uniref:alpha-D-xyloside xylohydrolase n=1 Tax=Filobasidium floriforme TaxID=5210 RepID=A0A8K0JH53_9TREE|nr:hypothetical protein FFLO_05334 [Filobasidium floriforme]
MRFTDGLWLKRAGVDFRGGVEVAEILNKDEKTGIDYLVACRHIANRGDSMDGPLLTFNVSSPADDIIKVRVDHFKGVRQKSPNFELFPDSKPPAPKVTINSSTSSDTLSLQSGSLKASINLKEYSYGIRFTSESDEKKQKGEKPLFLCSTEPKSTAVIDVPPSYVINQMSESSCLETGTDALLGSVEKGNSSKIRFMLNELSLTVGETIYGLGERFTPLVKNGGSHSIWNQDGGTSSQQAYKNIPFYLSSRGYGIFVNHTEEVDFEVGAEKCSKVGISVRGEGLEYYVINGGGSLKRTLELYCLLTGRPALPPSWTFGLYMSTSFTTSYDEKTVSGFLEGMKERECYTRVLHLDCYWMKAYDWCSFQFDDKAFPDPASYLRTVKDKYNVKVCVWINPYISQRAHLFKEGVEKGYFIKRANGDVWQWDLWQPGMAYVDFTNPDACKWYAKQLEGLMDIGVDTFKTDFGERIPHKGGVTYFDGSDPRLASSYYTQIFNDLVFTTLKNRLGEHGAAVFARSATAGGQRFPVHWGGDCESTYEAMAESLRGGLSLTSSGFAFWSHDIGGFEGLPPAAVFKRWVAFGLFSSHSRLHGSKSFRVPWLYDDDGKDEASKVLAKMVKAKLRLMPYLFAQAIKSHETGVPMMRSMVIDFPEDPTCQYLDKQYMLGDNVLVAPVFSDDTANFYLPEGKWTCFWTNAVTTGPRWIKKENYPFTAIPVFVKENSVLLLGPDSVDVPDYEYSKVGLEVRAYQIPSDAEVVVQVPSGKGPEWAGKVVVKGGKAEGQGVKVDSVADMQEKEGL